MKRYFIAIALLAVIGSGCAQLQNARQPDNLSAGKKIETRNNAASLLYDLVGDEQNVYKVLLVKHHSKELGDLIRMISTTAAQDKQQLEQWATNDPGLKLQAMDLPPGEMEARKAISKVKEHDLLLSSGKVFEFDLLLTQFQALNYGWHLAEVAADNSSRPEEAREFRDMGKSMKELYGQTMDQLHSGIQRFSIRR